MLRADFVDFPHRPVIVETKSGVFANTVTHYHDNIELTLYEHSACRVFCQENWYEICDGSLLWLPRYSIHRVDYMGTERNTRLQLLLQPEVLQPALAAMGGEALLHKEKMDKCHHRILKPAQVQDFLRRFTELQKIYNSWQENPTPVNNCVLQAQLIWLLFEVFACMEEDSDEQKPLAQSNRYVKQAIKYVDSHFAQTISLDLLAEQLHIDKYYLCHVFKQHVGLTIVKYAQYRRVIEAQKMMLYSDKPMDEIASACGFNCRQHFYKVFKEVTGYPPGQYKTK